MNFWAGNIFESAKKQAGGVMEVNSTAYPEKQKNSCPTPII
jgi:hypothetical protein